jgi:hypothetical protein
MRGIGIEEENPDREFQLPFLSKDHEFLERFTRNIQKESEKIPGGHFLTRDLDENIPITKSLLIGER